MHGMLPEWFRSDEIFSDEGRWYFGARGGLHVAPYGDRELASARSLSVSRRLRALRTDADRLRYVRKVLHEEWESLGVSASAAEAETTIDLSPPSEPVRSGERQRKWCRSSRFFQIHGVWFVSTREGINIGPYGTQFEARKHERHLIALLVRARDPAEARRVIYRFKHRPNLTGTPWSQTDEVARTG
jgi:hypothetical protein